MEPPATPSESTPNDLVNTGCVQGAAPDGSGRYVLYSTTDQPITFRRYVNGAPGAISPEAYATSPQMNENDFILVAASLDLAPGVYTNCATATALAGTGSPIEECGNVDIGPIDMGPLIRKTLLGYPGSSFTGYYYPYSPLTDPPSVPVIDGVERLQGPSDLIYSVQIWNRIESGVDWVDPVVTDLLDPNVDWKPSPEGTNFWVVSLGRGWYGSPSQQPACATPEFTVTENWNGTGRTQLKWEFIGCTLQAGSWGNSEGEYNNGLKVYFSTTIKPGVPADTTIANGAETPVGTSQECNWNAVDAYDTEDVDGDGDTSESICDSSIRNYTMTELATTESSKWVHGGSDPTEYFSRYPNVGLADANGAGTYEMFIENTGNVAMSAAHIVDVLPFIGDSMTVDASIVRGSQWAEELAGAITLEYLPASLTVDGGPRAQDWSQATTLTAGSNYQVWYSDSTNPCRMDATDQLKISTSLSEPAGCDPQPALGSGTAVGANSFGV
jgi:hypothetical protein